MDSSTLLCRVPRHPDMCTSLIVPAGWCKRRAMIWRDVGPLLLVASPIGMTWRQALDGEHVGRLDIAISFIAPLAAPPHNKSRDALLTCGNTLVISST